MWAPVAAAALLAFQPPPPSGTSPGARLEKSRLAAAIPRLELAHKRNPDDAAVRHDLALAYIETNQLDRARRFLRAELDRLESAELHNLLGLAEDRSGDFKTAALEFEKAARLDPSERNLFDLGNHLVNYGGFDQAETVFRYALRNHPSSARIHVGLGVALYSLSRYDEALETLCKAVDLDPSDPRPLEFLGRMQGASPSMSREVSRRLADFAARFPSNASAHFYYAMSLRDAPGESASAERHFQRALELDPKLAAAHFQLGVIHEENGRPQDAQRCYVETLRLNPEDAAAHYRLAQIYGRAGKASLAKKHLDAWRALRTPEAKAPHAR